VESNVILLNVGGGRSRELPTNFSGWDQHLLDVDPAVSPDVVCDARQMLSLPAATYDAILCSHVLEHFHPHETSSVLAGFQHVLKDDGYAHIAVPNIGGAIETMVAQHRDINDVWYQSPVGPITFHDALYGYRGEIANGNAWYCHKTGFTKQSLSDALYAAHFQTVIMSSDETNLHAFAFKRTHTLETALQHAGALAMETTT